MDVRTDRDKMPKNKGKGNRTQNQVKDLVLRGHSIKEMASKINCSEQCVKHHLTILYKEYKVDRMPKLMIKLAEEKRDKSLISSSNDLQVKCPLVESLKKEGN